jgi:drug/metabolite transporter (DMT)-like permease
MADSPPDAASLPNPGGPSGDRSNKLVARLLIVAAAILWSTAGFLARAPVFEGWCETAWLGTLQAFWRSLFAAAVLLPFVRRPRWNWRLIPMTLIFAAMNVLYLSAINLTTPANAIWLQATAPVWVFLAGVFWFRERASGRDWLLLLLSMCGVATILYHEIGGEELLGVACGLLSGVAFAAVMLLLRRLRAEDASWLIALNHSVTAIVLFPIVVWYGVWPAAAQWPFLIALGALQMGIPYVLFVRGVRLVASHEASCIVLLEPVLLPVWVLAVWGDSPPWWTIAGGAMILVGLLIRYLPVRQQRETNPPMS